MADVSTLFNPKLDASHWLDLHLGSKGQTRGGWLLGSKFGETPLMRRELANDIPAPRIASRVGNHVDVQVTKAFPAWRVRKEATIPAVQLHPRIPGKIRSSVDMEPSWGI